MSFLSFSFPSCYRSLFSCFIRISYFVGYPADINEMNVRTPHIHRYESIHKTQFLSFNIIGCFSLILTSPLFFCFFFFFCSFFFCLPACLSVGSLLQNAVFISGLPLLLSRVFSFSLLCTHQTCARTRSHTYQEIYKDRSMRTTDNEV